MIAAMKLKKKTLAPWKKSCDKSRQCIKLLKSQSIILPSKVCLVKTMVSPVMYGCELDHKESWVLKNWCFWNVVLEKMLESSLDCKEIQSILKEINPEHSLEGLMLKLKRQYFGHLCEGLTHWKTPWCWEGLGAGGEGDDRGWDGWMASRLDGHEFEWTLGVGDRQRGLACCDSWGHKESDMTEQLNCTEPKCNQLIISL